MCTKLSSQGVSRGCCHLGCTDSQYLRPSQLLGCDVGLMSNADVSGGKLAAIPESVHNTVMFPGSPSPPVSIEF